MSAAWTKLLTRTSRTILTIRALLRVLGNLKAVPCPTQIVQSVRSNYTRTGNLGHFPNVGYDSVRAMIEMGIVSKLILPDRRKQYTVLISYDEPVTSNTLSHVQTP